MQPETAADLFRALSVPSRMRILMLLKSEGPLPVKTIAESLEMTSPAVSQHLKVLRHVGLVQAERHGYWVPYAIDARALSNCCGSLVRMCACPSCHGESGANDEAAGASGGQQTEESILLRHREELLAELQRVETELDRLREG